MGNKTKTKRAGSKLARKEKLRYWGFYLAIVALPVIQFCIFYIAVNINSFKLAFETYSNNQVIKVGFDNFINIFKTWSSTNMTKAIGNSLLAFVCNSVIGISLALVFSYYIYKKMPMSRLFKIVLFLPSIVSEIIMVVMYRQITEGLIPAVCDLVGVPFNGLTTSENSSVVFVTILIYNLWIGFGAQILMYVGNMSGISESIIDAGKIDGVTPFKEFIHIVLPSIYPTIIVFITTNIVQIFTSRFALFSFYGTKANPSIQTIGYILYVGVQGKSIDQYPQVAALGILCTIVAIPLTVLARWAMRKLGPKED